jgi:hypothetical protein
MVYDFLQLLHIRRSYSTKNDYFISHIQFTILYLLQKQKLNHRNYYEQKINKIYFIHVKGYDMNMHAYIPWMNMHGFL